MTTILKKLLKDGIDMIKMYPNIVNEKVRSYENMVVVLKNDKTGKKKTIEVREI